MDLKSVIILVGLCIGSLTLIAVIIVYIRQKSVGNGGVILAVLGVILIGGLSVWHQISIELPGDIKIVISGLQQEYRELEKEVNTINSANNSVLTSLATLETELRKPSLDKTSVLDATREIEQKSDKLSSSISGLKLKLDANKLELERILEKY